ncbi:hypothetical protein VB796_14900 [Arcicella sp. LKC2W]|uniref:hypothetical protein n=1 Tax=Arcicella sp. LKC2W TaxID=2984198 RepID=UPI002B21151F|nr:hypothetical protein [Arcicella sp. LKC2W]MEA5460340.1 hypothetical protein [Arcicella sp. LKC2W]
MDKLYVNLQNCYGIKKMQATFNFENCRAAIIYAQNGAMKTSFAEVFCDIIKGRQSEDRIFKNRISTYEVKYDGEQNLHANQILVIKPYIEKYKSDEKQTTLLVNDVLKEKYEAIVKSLDDKKNELLKELSNLSGLKKDVESEFIKSFMGNGMNFYNILENLENTIFDSTDPLFSNILYSEIFNTEVLKFLGTKDFKIKIKEYIEVYNDLISKCTYFKTGVFNHYNAEEIIKSLKGNSFFPAGHTVFLNSNKFDSQENTKKEITSEKELIQIFDDEKNQVLNNVELKGKFDAIDNAIKNKQLRDFRTYLENNKDIIPELEKLGEFNKKLWISYLKKEKVLFEELLKLYKDGKEEIAKIAEVARNEVTTWERVVKIFNDRFIVPFELIVENQVDVILHSASPKIIYKYTDEYTGEDTKIGEDELLLCLSLGEKRARYLLNVIFEIEVKKNTEDKTLLIIDDIADSFDYKNKYAIIEYLKENFDTGLFNMIILTHNFDFHRTVSARLNIYKCNVLNSRKENGEITLKKEIYQKNPFEYWKNQFHQNDEIMIAGIAFVRNIIQYTIGVNDNLYIKLSSLLHIKKNSETITVQDLEDVFNLVLRQERVFQNKSKPVLELILELSDSLSINLVEELNLEKKIVLSIGIRLIAEKYMIGQINDDSFIENIAKKKNPTRELYDRIKLDDSVPTQNIQTLEKVNLMTPENIHLNSFMYEPILDLSDSHLKKLYLAVKALC